jgi:predicted YcjX-like family ATPase
METNSLASTNGQITLPLDKVDVRTTQVVEIPLFLQKEVNIFTAETRLSVIHHSLTANVDWDVKAQAVTQTSLAAAFAVYLIHCRMKGYESIPFAEWSRDCNYVAKTLLERNQASRQTTA